MEISVFGLGYVGTVSAGCLAQTGHNVYGVDPNQTKVDSINLGRSPIIEAEVDGIVSAAVNKGRLRAGTSVEEAISITELSLICVGTPSLENGSLDLTAVQRVCEQIGSALKSTQSFHTVVVRSTLLPGSLRDCVIPTLEKFSGKRCGVDFGLCSNPEFLREGTAVYDYFHPPKIVIGESEANAGDIVAQLYKDIDAPLIRTALETAEMVKYTDNVWHALKISFANEIGTLCKGLNIDSHEVMDIFCQDLKLNISSYYLRPGFAFGGSCLPKDVRALTYKAKIMDLNLPLLSAILPSNKEQVDRGLKLIMKHSSKRVGVLGFSFKAGTDDLRESPVVEMVEMLIGKGYSVKLYDRNVKLAGLVGANRNYILEVIPHISSLMVDSIENVLSSSDIIVIGNGDPEFSGILNLTSGSQVVVDLARVSNRASRNGYYEGIAW